MNDLGYAVRRIRRNAGFALVAVLTLGLGIGATTALFTVVNGVLLRGLPYPDPDRLVLLYSAIPDRGADREPVSVPDFRDWSERSRTVTRMGIYTTRSAALVLLADDGARELRTAYVSWGFFPTLGVDPLIGRVFRPEDETGDARVVVLSHGLWTRQFGADPSLVGKTITLSDQQFQVVGVMPPGFEFPQNDIEVWAPFTVIPATSVPLHLRPMRFMDAVGRLASGATLAQARQELTAVAMALSQEYPETNAGWQAAGVVPLREALVGNVRPALLVLFGAVGFVLLIACVNVANLLLARGIGRQREMAVRAAAGAGRARIVRMLLAESLVLGRAGVRAGVLGRGPPAAAERRRSSAGPGRCARRPRAGVRGGHGAARHGRLWPVPRHRDGAVRSGSAAAGGRGRSRGDAAPRPGRPGGRRGGHRPGAAGGSGAPA